MSSDPAPESNPELFVGVEHYVSTRRDERMYVTKRDIERDLTRSILRDTYLREAGIDPEHPNAMRTFRRVLWPVVRQYMCPRTGWWSRSRGASAQFFHEDWGTPEDCRDAVNCLLRDRQHDQASINRLVSITESKCGQLGWSFDPQYDDTGELVAMEVWEKIAA